MLKKLGVISYMTFATKNLKARCDVARQPLWRYVKDRHHSCDDTWSSAINLKKYYYLSPLVAELHMSSQLWWPQELSRNVKYGSSFSDGKSRGATGGLNFSEVRGSEIERR